MLDSRVEFLPPLEGNEKLKSSAICSDHARKTVISRRVLDGKASFDVGIDRKVENLPYNCARQTGTPLHYQPTLFSPWRDFGRRQRVSVRAASKRFHCPSYFFILLRVASCLSNCMKN